MKKRYWRKDSFEGLKKVIDLLRVNSDKELYSNYCETKEKWLRKRALTILEEFIETLSLQTLNKRIKFTDWVEERRLNNYEVIDLIPILLQMKLIEPNFGLMERKRTK